MSNCHRVQCWSLVDGYQRYAEKIYKKRADSTVNNSRCRLCNKVTDPDHSKRLISPKTKPLYGTSNLFMTVNWFNTATFHSYYADHVNDGLTMLCSSKKLSPILSAKENEVQERNDYWRYRRLSWDRLWEFVLPLLLCFCFTSTTKSRFQRCSRRTRKY